MWFLLYTGIAKDVEARFAAHLKGKGAMLTRLNRLCPEYAFKQLSRAAKLHWLRNCANL